VEPDEKAMPKKSKRAQLSILSAGSFSNFLFAIIFLLIFQLFFIGCYNTAGVIGYMYTFEQINITNIEKIGNYTLEGFLDLSDAELQNIQNTTELLPIKTRNKIYYLKSELYPFFEQAKKGKTKTIIVYEDTPAIRVNLSGAIQKIDDYRINNIEDVHQILSSHKPNDTIKIQTTEKNYSITLSQHPTNSSIGYLGIGFPQLPTATAFLSKLTSPFFSPYSYIIPKYNLEFLTFIRDLLFWLVLICFSVALINMLPIGMLDGGRFIYVVALGMTKSKKKAEFVYKIAALLVLLIFLILMFVWLAKAF